MRLCLDYIEVVLLFEYAVTVIKEIWIILDAMEDLEESALF